MPETSVSVIIITRDRPAAMLRMTLAALGRQTAAPLETLVVDTSAGDALPRMIAAEFPWVRALHVPDGPRNMSWSRNRGIAAANGEVVAFLDDDSIAEPQWLAEIVRAYGADPAIGGAGGRIVEGSPLPVVVPPDQKVSTVDARGGTRANFNALTAGIVEADHLKGCNMSFRRVALAQIGNFDEAFNGPVRDETDVCVRIRRAGYRLVYNPDATVEHKAFSLSAHKRVQLESVVSGYPVARLDGYYVAKNFGPTAWAAWYVLSNGHALGRVGKVTYMAFARALLGLAGGLAGLVQATRWEAVVRPTDTKTFNAPAASTPRLAEGEVL